MAWHVFLDESGRFADRNDVVCVAGVGFAVGRVPDQGALEARLQHKFGFVPWPFHAAHLNFPVLLAVAAWVTAEDTGLQLSPRYVNLFDRLRAQLRRSEPFNLQQLESFVRGGAKVSYAGLRSLQSCVRRSDQPWLDDLGRTFFKNLRAVCGELAADGGFATIAWESEVGGARQTSDGYQALISALMAGLSDTLPSVEPCSLGVHALGRDVDGTPLDKDRLQAWADEAAGLGRVDVLGVHRFGRRTLALLVIADFVANRCRWLLRNEPGPDGLDGRVRRATGFGLVAADDVGTAIVVGSNPQ